MANLENQEKHMLLRDGVQAEDIKIYELYLQRTMKEMDLIWQRFKLFFAFNSGALLCYGFVVKPLLEKGNNVWPHATIYSLYLICIIGFFASWAWRIVSIKGAYFQEFMHAFLERIENELFENRYFALFKTINSDENHNILDRAPFSAEAIRPDINLKFTKLTDVMRFTDVIKFTDEIKMTDEIKSANVININYWMAVGFSFMWNVLFLIPLGKHLKWW